MEDTHSMSWYFTLIISLNSVLWTSTFNSIGLCYINVVGSVMVQQNLDPNWSKFSLVWIDQSILAWEVQSTRHMDLNKDMCSIDKHISSANIL